MVIVRILGRIGIGFIAFLILIGLVSTAVAFGGKNTECVDIHTLSATSSVAKLSHADEIFTLPNYIRDEQITFLRFPEWYIVYSAREYSTYLNASGTPSTFPYNAATAQYWCSYSLIKKHIEGQYPQNSWWHTVLVVIGSSFSAENLIQEAYEKTIGNLSLLGGGADTPEDQVERDVAGEYAKLLDVVPWYYYPFFTAVQRVWQTPPVGDHMLRKWERRFALTIGYGVKGAYGILMGKANGDSGEYAATELSELLTVRMPLPDRFANDERIKMIKDFGDGVGVIEVPRYQVFTDLMKEFAGADVKILDISGNKSMLISFFAPNDWKYDLSGEEFFAMPVVVDANSKRIMAVVSNAELLDTIRQMQKEKITLEHVYDY